MDSMAERVIGFEQSRSLRCKYKTTLFSFSLSFSNVLMEESSSLTLEENSCQFHDFPLPLR